MTRRSRRATTAGMQAQRRRLEHELRKLEAEAAFIRKQNAEARELLHELATAFDKHEVALGDVVADGLFELTPEGLRMAETAARLLAAMDQVNQSSTD